MFVFLFVFICRSTLSKSTQQSFLISYLLFKKLPGKKKRKKNKKSQQLLEVSIEQMTSKTVREKEKGEKNFR